MFCPFPVSLVSRAFSGQPFLVYRRRLGLGFLGRLEGVSGVYENQCYFKTVRDWDDDLLMRGGNVANCLGCGKYCGAKPVAKCAHCPTKGSVPEFGSPQKRGFFGRLFGSGEDLSAKSALAVETKESLATGRPDLDAMVAGLGKIEPGAGDFVEVPGAPGVQDVGNEVRLDEVARLLRARDEERNRRSPGKSGNSTGLSDRLRLVRELNARDAADTSPIPEGWDVVWRVECPCCSSGPVTMWPWGQEVAEAHYAPDPSDVGQRRARERIARLARDGGRGTMADLPASGQEFLPMYENGAGMSVVRDANDPQGRQWFPQPSVFHRLGFEWAAYAVPPGAAIDGEHETVIDRTRSRRLGLLSLDEGGTAGGGMLARARAGGDALWLEERRPDNRRKSGFVASWPTRGDVDRLVHPSV